ncbi:MAG: serine hydrolase [Chloroflexia bacterium]|nr:serine hydrolase [Chloroflexia bacterium]
MKKLLIILLIFILLILVSFFFSPKYLQNALIYQTPDIDDYQIFNNREVEAGNYIPWDSAVDYNKKELSKATIQRIDSLLPVAFLVVQNGKLKYEKYWNEYSDSSLSNSFSMAKSIISLLIGIAIDDGLIKSVDQPVADFIEEFNTKENKNLKVKDLLTMSSGLNWDEHYSSPFSLTTQAYYGEDLRTLIKELNVIEPSGEKWNYLSGNTQLLALVLEKACGTSVSEFASKKLWKPIGAKNPALWSMDNPEGTEKAYCCFNSNARDFARIGQLILNEGMYDDIQVVSKAFLDSATRAANYLKDERGNSVDFYGYQFWIVNYKGYRIPFARGILGQYIFVIPGKNAVVVRLGHKRSESRTIKPEMPDDVYLYLEAAMEVLD